MASFRTHFTVAAVVSVGAAATLLQTASLSYQETCLLAALGALAGILPDVDSDHSVPTRLLFRLLSGLSAGLVMFVFNGQLHVSLLLALAVLAGLLVRYMVYPLFASITVHRGLFHSLPAALLLSLSVAWLALSVFQCSVAFAWWLAAFAGGGYVLHLLLDEFYSVDFMGRSLKTSFGSALTVFSFSSWLSYAFMYLLVVAGLYTMPLPNLLRSWLL